MTNDILETIGEGAKWLAIGGGSYIGALMVFPLITDLFSDKIKTQEQLEKILKEEKIKLRINEEVRGHLSDRLDGHVHYAKNDLMWGTPHIICVGGSRATRACVKHELYHIKKQHWNKPQNYLLNGLDSWFRREPQAVAYEIFGLKL